MSNNTISTLESKIEQLQQKLSNARKKEAEKLKEDELRRKHIFGSVVLKALEDGVLDNAEISQIVDMYASERDKTFALKHLYIK